MVKVASAAVPALKPYEKLTSALRQRLILKR